MKSTSTFLIIAAIVILGVFIHVKGVSNVNLDGNIKVDGGELSGQLEHNMSEIMIVVYLPDESCEITNKNLIEVSEVTNLSVNDVKNAEYFVCHNEEQCIEIENNLTEIIEENPYMVPKPTGNAFGVKIINKTEEQ